MLRITIEMIPGGVETAKYTMGLIEIANDNTGTFEIGNYEATLYAMPPIAKRKHVWKKTTIRKFPRRLLGPYDLLYRVLHATIAKRNP